jgi:NADH-quinone oxidoreductase subunit G
LRAPEELTGSNHTALTWEEAYRRVAQTLRQAVEKNGPGSLLTSVSPFDSTEDLFLQIKFVRSIDPQAWLVLPPVRVDGADQAFKNPASGQVTFTLRAEKAPNRRGAEKMFAHFGGNVCTLAEVADKKIAAAVISTDPLRPHNMDERMKASLGIPTILRLGMRPAGLYERAVLNLPTCSWAEKSGVYENIDGRIQAFGQAIPALEETRATGRIFWDLLGLPGVYSAAGARELMVAAGLGEYAGIAEPVGTVKVEEMEFAAL